MLKNDVIDFKIQNGNISSEKLNSSVTAGENARSRTGGNRGMAMSNIKDAIIVNGVTGQSGEYDMGNNPNDYARANGGSSISTIYGGVTYTTSGKGADVTANASWDSPLLGNPRKWR